MATEVGKRRLTINSEPITYERIAQRAYERYLQRGAMPGDELQDWLAAERELTQLPVQRKKKTVAAMTDKPAVAKAKTVKATWVTTTTRHQTKPEKEAKRMTDQQ